MPRPEDRGVPSNWGRWGDDDQRGTANLLCEAGVLAASKRIGRGKVYSLATPIAPDGPNLPTRRPTWHVVTQRARPGSGDDMSADDVIMMHTHAGTHIDSLCHIFVGDTLYNGHPSSSLTPYSAQRCGIQNVGPIVGRGILLDVARFKGRDRLESGEPITPDDLDACAKAEGIEVQPGDIVLIRTGWWPLHGEGPEARKQFYAGEPGPDGDCGNWFHARDLVALGADNPAVEVVSSWASDPLPVHRSVIWGCGGYLLEFLDLEALARDRHYEFMFVATPLQIEGGVGSPIVPLAIV